MNDNPQMPGELRRPCRPAHMRAKSSYTGHGPISTDVTLPVALLAGGPRPGAAEAERVRSRRILGRPRRLLLRRGGEWPPAHPRLSHLERLRAGQGNPPLSD